jgi:phenylpyruvate tautomerase PptA (4-oxalocrotonate tautomerase family)
MPIYQCYIPTGSLGADTRAELAEAITDIHCTITASPRGFAHVVFIEYGESSFFTAGQPNNISVLYGIIRAGRDRQTQAEMLTKLVEAWTSITGQDVRSVVIGLNDIEPTSAMEAGLIMPAPGEEAEFLQRHQEQLGPLLSMG